MQVECCRCGRVLSGAATERLDVPLAFFIAALLLLLPAVSAPLMTVASMGAQRQNWLTSGVSAFWQGGFPLLATLIAGCSVVLPFVFLSLQIAVLAGIHFHPRISAERETLGRMFRWARTLRPWMMLEVYLLGGFVAYSRLDAIVRVDIGIGGWFLILATFALLLALTQLNERAVWESLSRGTRPSGKDLIACQTCDLVVAAHARDARCPRCLATLRSRKPNALSRTAALVVAGYLLYLPANILPVLTIVRLGHEERNTILSGVRELLRDQEWPLALIVFTASIVVPLVKLGALTWMLIATHLRSEKYLVARTRLHRFIDVVGRWSNIDVFMGSILIALLRFGNLTTVRVNDGLLAFAAVVLITMFATMVFDSRLMWDAARSKA
jgi:paraquat-inducible protein A